MNETPTFLVQPLAYRAWDPDRRSFFYTDVTPETSALVDRWTGFFDKQGQPIYQNDIIRVHHDWKFGWVRALVTRHPQKQEYVAEATATDGTVLRVGFYSFADAYRVGNAREHPGKLTRATEQFSKEAEAWWLRPAIFRSSLRSALN